MYQCASVLHHRFGAKRLHRLCIIGPSASCGLEFEYYEGAEDIFNGDIPAGLTVGKAGHFGPKRNLSSHLGHV